jgi:hypothetical protein
MKNQQQAEKEEQQRIKNLVLNYDLRENEDADGELNSAPLKANPNIHTSYTGNDKTTMHHHNRADNRSVKERGGQRVRKLQLSDVDWYEHSQKQNSSFTSATANDLPSRHGSFGPRCRRALNDPLSEATPHREMDSGENHRPRPSRGGPQRGRGRRRPA